MTLDELKEVARVAIAQAEYKTGDRVTADLKEELHYQILRSLMDCREQESNEAYKRAMDGMKAAWATLEADAQAEINAAKAAT
jgi:hypothetical protein